nr:retrovirus-related Pol polyprotein from transposon TNT 1-94 [Tanacetum cinerariifolium]
MIDITLLPMNIERLKTEYKKIKAKLALLEASPSTSQTPKTFQSKNKGLVVETFNWDEEEVLDDEEMTEVKVLMALVDDELTVRKNHARNGKWIDITMRKENISLGKVVLQARRKPMEDQLLPANASPTALSLDYVVDSDLEKDEKDPKEDPTDFPADIG